MTDLTHVQFDHVSKQYRLGKARTSLRRMASDVIHRIRFGDSPALSDKEILWALRDVNFKLSPGETMGLVGQNGAGKSTILKLVANITRPTTGDIMLNGRVSALIELGAGFHPDLSGRDNVYLNGVILGLSRQEIRDRFDEIVDFAELDRFIDTPLKRYSSGMKIRLGFAVAACINPDILLVDEVLAVGDASFRQKCLQRIQELRQTGTSIIFVSHNLYLVKAVCDRSLYIKGGQVVFRGPTADVIEEYERDIHEQRVQQYESLHEREEVASEVVVIQQVEIARPGTLVGEEDLLSEQPAIINIHYKTQRHMERANVVIRIIRADGLTCCMMRTSLDDYQLQQLAGNGSISVRLDPLQLIGGKYYVEARITDKLDSLILATAWSDWFYVKGNALSYQERSGVFEPNTTWGHGEPDDTNHNHQLNEAIPLPNNL